MMFDCYQHQPFAHTMHSCPVHGMTEHQICSIQGFKRYICLKCQEADRLYEDTQE